MKIRTSAIEQNREGNKNRKIFIISDPKSTINRNERNIAIKKFGQNIGLDVVEVRIEQGSIIKAIRAIKKNDIVVAQVAPRRNIIFLLLLPLMPKVIELRDPICDWRFRKGLKNKSMDLLFTVVARLCAKIILARNGLNICGIERFILKSKLEFTPQYGVSSNYIFQNKNKKFEHRICYFGNIYDEFYKEGLNKLSLAVNKKIIWVGCEINITETPSSSRIKKYPPVSKKDAYAMQLAAGANVLINSFPDSFIPSKFYELLAFGRPIIYLCPYRDKIARFIDRHQLGIVLTQTWVEKKISTPLTVNNYKLQQISRISQKLFSDDVYHRKFWREVSNAGALRGEK
ncbi:glycosyltransferase family protein [Salibaculum griseiflavum]|uniref:glycosyltransferase family 4 protein n=1 Tax=Salibaculum griseiflavum TaxID=1914409 RepID=UPI0011B1DC5F|nr:glycosyltransferase family 4 protein [Salibaculum griseiflavum]